MKILLINQYGPGSGAPTGRLVGELAALLRQAGYEVRVLATDPVYGDTRRGFLRWLHEFKSHVLILLRGLVSERVSLVISLTSPVCLVVTASIIASAHRAKTCHWAMDLYPDIAVALKEIKPGMLEQCLRRCVQLAYNSTHTVVALDRDMQSYLARRYAVSSVIIPPWPEAGTLESINKSVSINAQTRWEWIYSGNLGRAHEWEILAQAQSALEKKGLPIWLVIQGSGPSIPLLKNQAALLDLKQCEFREYVPREELCSSLLAARVLVVTQRKETTGLLWPSKLALLIKLPRPLVWIGDCSSMTASLLATRPLTYVFEPGQSQQVAECLEILYKQEQEFQWKGCEFAGDMDSSPALWLDLIKTIS